MRYTFGQAKLALAKYASAYGLMDVGAAVNVALDELARGRNWARLRKTVRLDVGSEYFALPQDCGALVRAAVDQTPVSVRGTEYEFLHAGPGDLDFAEAGWAPLNGIQRIGVFPTMFALTDIMPLAAFTTTAAPSGPLRVRGRNADGDRIAEDVPVNVWTGPDDTVDPDTISKTTNEFADIDSVTLPSDASNYITLSAISSDDDVYVLSRMHPKIVIPEFTRYRLPGFDTATTDKVYRVLAEVALRFIPLVDDDEVVPFDSLLPVQYMMQSVAAMEAGEIKTADDYRQRAEVLLARREESELEKQTLHVVNMLYDGSVGEMTNRFENI
ncbi:MAG: hypothetical protein FJ279_00475 [Planctomycetes bacterium]|nr:hypothetical protein [Planctomycetota bacterium]